MIASVKTVTQDLPIDYLFPVIRKQRKALDSKYRNGNIIDIFFTKGFMKITELMPIPVQSLASEIEEKEAWLDYRYDLHNEGDGANPIIEGYLLGLKSAGGDRSAQVYINEVIARIEKPEVGVW